MAFDRDLSQSGRIASVDGQCAARHIAAAQEHRPEVVLLDIGLPGMDGYEVARQLRQEACCQDALVIAVSGHGRPEDQRRCREAGFDQHLIKPVDPEILITVLSSPRPQGGPSWRRS